MPDWGDLPPIFINPSAAQPKYLQLAHALEQHIKSGTLVSHTRLPGENDLFDLLGLSRSTIRRALEILEEARLVYRKQGLGTFIAEYSGAPQHKTETPARGGTVGLLVPSMDNEIYPQIVKGVEDAAAARGWTVYIGNTYGDRVRELRLLQQMCSGGVQALIIEPTNARDDVPGDPTWDLLNTCTLPCVLLDNDVPGLALPAVMLDDRAGGALACRHLISLGHRDIAIIYQETVLAAQDRYRGYLDALAEHGISPDPSLIIAFDPTREHADFGHLLTSTLLANRKSLGLNPPSAIFYFNDELALRGITSLRNAGLRIPEDISVLGFDNIQSGAASDIQLSTLDHPKYFCGRWAADILFERIDRGIRAPVRRITIEPDLIIRSSTGPGPYYSKEAQ